MLSTTVFSYTHSLSYLYEARSQIASGKLCVACVEKAPSTVPHCTSGSGKDSVKIQATGQVLGQKTYVSVSRSTS